jgi:hypothetical protein
MKTVEFLNPVFFDKKVQDLNTELETLGWIESQYPICQRGEMEEGSYVEAYYNDGSMKNLRVMPEGNSLSFFEIAGDIVQVEEYNYTVPLSLTVWADLRKVHTTKDYDYTAELIKDVIGILKKNGCNDLIIKTDQVMEESFLQKKLNQNTMRPWTAFKISFTCLLTTC